MQTLEKLFQVLTHLGLTTSLRGSAVIIFRDVERLSNLLRSYRGRQQIQEADSRIHAVNGLAVVYSKHNIPAVSMHVSPTHLTRTTLHGASSLCLPQQWH